MSEALSHGVALGWQIHVPIPTPSLAFAIYFLPAGLVG